MKPKLHLTPYRLFPMKPLSPRIHVPLLPPRSQMKMSTVKPSFIDLRKGHPTHRLLPTEPLKSALGKIFSGPNLAPERYPDDMHPLQYGPDPGNITTRKALRRWLNQIYIPAIFRSEIPFTHESKEEDEEQSARRIALTGGASGALSFILQLFTDEDTKAIILEPTYFFAKRVFEDAEFTVENGRLRGCIWRRPVRVSSGRDAGSTEDLRGGELEDSLLKTLREIVGNANLLEEKPPRFSSDGRRRKIFDYVLYISGSTFHNPSGRTLTECERHTLIKLARRYNILLISDDVYDFLSYTSDPSSPANPEGFPARLVDIDRLLPSRTEGGNTVSNGSWSKIFGGGIRSGWIESADDMLAESYSQGGATKSGGDMGHFASCIIGELLERDAEGLWPVVRELREVYGRRVKAMKAVLESVLPRGCDVYGGNGGYFLWVGVGEGVNGQEVVEEATKKNLRLLGIDECIVDESEKGLKGSGWVRLGVCWEEEDAALEGCRRLGEIVRKVRERQQ